MVVKEYVPLLVLFIAVVLVDAKFQTDFLEGLLSSIIFMSVLVHLLRQRGEDDEDIRLRLRCFFMTIVPVNGIGYMLAIDDNIMARFLSSAAAMLVGYFYVSNQVLDQEDSVAE